jgi:hypothetical protein
MIPDKEPYIFADKNRIIVTYWDKSLTVRTNFEKIFARYKLDLDEKQIISIPEYSLLWVSIAELYSILKYRYLKIFSKDREKDMTRLEKILETYRMRKEVIGIFDTRFVVEILTECCSMNKFDDVSLDRHDEEVKNIEESF